MRRRRVVGRIHGTKYTVEKAIKTEIDTRTEEKGVGKLGWFMSKR